MRSSEVADLDAFILGMEGVVVDTGGVAGRAWRRLFDDVVGGRAPGRPAPFTEADYGRYIAGREPVEAVTGFLASRGVRLPRGGPDDPPSAATVWGLANRESALFVDELDAAPLPVFDSTVAFVRSLRSHGVKTGVVSGDRNARHVLGAAGISGLFDVRLDGLDSEALGLAAAPDAAMVREAAQRLGVRPDRAAVVDATPAGVEAGHRGGFGLVIGVDQGGRGEALAAAGADLVVTDMAEVAVPPTRPRAPSGCRLCAGLDELGEWVLGYTDDAPEVEGTRESLLTLGNGYLATRGARPECVADSVHYPGTYVAGVYNRLVSVLDGREREDESLVNLPNWLSLTFRVEGGAWFGTGDDVLDHHHVALDVRRGILHREALVVDGAGRHTRVRQRRLVSMAAPHLAALETVLVPENWSGRLEIRSVIDGGVVNGNVAAFAGLADRHLRVTGTGRQPDDETVWLAAETVQSRIRIAEAARTLVRPGDTTGGVSRRSIEGPDVVGHRVALDAPQGDPVTVDKVVAVFTSRDQAISEPLHAALDEVGHAGGFDDLLGPHDLAWALLWRRLRLGMDEGEHDQLAVNVHVFHVLQTLSSHTADLDVGVPARGLHGEGYRGHVFWDEMFVFPLLNFRVPQLTRALLLYRHRRLPQARRLAAESGRRGAQFPWQSGSDGREETPARFFNPRSGRWMADNSRRQHHVNLAIAYNVWQYWQVTGDAAFLATHGAELLVEIARFWASIATYDAGDDRYDIRGVMGPDEFHDGYPERPGQGIDNNAYVNVMTAWALARTVEAHRLLGRQHGSDLWERLGVTADEVAGWDRLARRLRVPFLDDGLLAQFGGYDRLAELDWDRYHDRYGNIGRLDLILEAEGDSTNRYKVSKQADVLMLFYLFTADELGEVLAQLGYRFDPATIPATVDHYLARTSHGSTLSRIAHAWVLARTDRARSWQILRDALAADLADTQGGTTREGVHLGAMAGTADMLERCYTGMEARGGVLRFDPQLPPELRALDLDVLYRDQRLTVHLDHRTLTLHALPGAAPPVRVGYAGAVHDLAAGHTLQLSLTEPAPQRRTETAR